MIARLRAQELLPRVNEHCTVRQVLRGGTQRVPLCDLSIRGVRHAALELVKHRVVVVGLVVHHGLLRAEVVPHVLGTLNVVQQVPRAVFLVRSVDEAGVRQLEVVALDGVAVLIVEESNARQFVGVLLVRTKYAGWMVPHLPAFTEDNDRRINLVECFADGGHRLNVMDPHQVETEPIDSIVLCPVRHRVDDVLAHHQLL